MIHTGLVKSYYWDAEGDFGLTSRDGSAIHFMDHGMIRIKADLDLSPVVRVNLMWMYKDVPKVRCMVADTDDKRRSGLKNVKFLDITEGMYFPYPAYTDVSFHQGGVPYSLDLLFLRDNRIVGLKKSTVVDSDDLWMCKQCSGVIELNGGFCDEYGVDVKDLIVLSSVSHKDLIEVEEEKHLNLAVGK